MEDERKAVESQQVHSSGQIRSAQKHAASVIIGLLTAILLSMIWVRTNAWVEESRAVDAGDTTALAILAVAHQQMGVKHSCGIDGTDGYERRIETLATFLGFDSTFHWQSPFIAEVAVSHHSKSGSSSSSLSMVVDASQVAIMSRPDTDQVKALCDALR